MGTVRELNLNNIVVKDALTRFLEADRATTREKKLARKIRPLQRRIAGHFHKQSDLFLRYLKNIKPIIDANAVSESISQSDWQSYWQMAAQASFSDFSDDVGEAIFEAMILGGEQFFAMTNTDAGEFGISWNLRNPRAVSYAEQQAAAQVTRINDTTRSYLNSLISNATAEGISYTRLSKMISDKFSEFATGGDNPRSRRIAVYELGDAYEAGNETAARELEAAGVDVERKWVTIGDDRVRPSHRDSQVEGWQSMDYVFSSGAMRSPTDPGCRCVMIYRRKRLTPAEKRRREMEDIDRAFQQELDQIDTGGTSHIRPVGKAPRGLGKEYADRRAIANKIDNATYMSGRHELFIQNYRGQKNQRRRYTIAVQRRMALDKAIETSMSVADGPGDWAFKRELINGIFDYASETTKGLR